MEYEVDSTVPLPTKSAKPNENPLYKVWRELKIGDSFVAPISQRAVVGHLMSFDRNIYDKDYTSQKISDTQVRIWRIK